MKEYRRRILTFSVPCLLCNLMEMQRKANYANYIVQLMFCEYLRYLLLDFKAEPTRILKYLIREMDAEKMKCKGKKGMRIFSYK